MSKLCLGISDEKQHRKGQQALDWSKTTKHQLDSWGVKYHDLKLGKPHYDLFIDDKVLNTNDWMSQEEEK